jgi:hypothetical protein
VVKRWAAFTRIEPELRPKVQERHSSQWAQFPAEYQFKLVVKEYCDYVELQYGRSESSQVVSVGADGSTAANTSPQLDPSWGWHENTAATDTDWDDEWWMSRFASLQNELGGMNFGEPLSTNESRILGFLSTIQGHQQSRDTALMHSLPPGGIGSMEFEPLYPASGNGACSLPVS